jgi:hypothetical protein
MLISRLEAGAIKRVMSLSLAAFPDQQRTLNGFPEA